MRVLSICAVVSLLISTNSFAAPTVIGNTISWPDDGWYQVQRVDGFDRLEVCAGGRGCDVLPGEYIVINHTTGDRFTGITVLDTEAPIDSVNPINVSGNTIRWPDDGWYQVQTANDYTEVCSGGNFCDTTPGTYVVINHTTGVRYENIAVAGENSAEVTPTPVSVIEVDQLTISWPDDGWYQVQDSVSFNTLCEGTRSCLVEPGTYNVINHTTGQRIEAVLVSALEPLSEPALEPEELDPLACNEDLASNHLTLDCFGVEIGLSVSYSISGNENPPFVSDLTSAGDFNGDGYPDLLVRVARSVESAAIILLGSAEGWHADIALNDPISIHAEAMNQERIVRFNTDYNSAFHIGDINADGYSDIAFPFDQDVRVIFGRANAGAQTYSLSSDSADIGLIMKTEMTLFNTSVTPAGDFNGDGIDDFLLASDIYTTINEANQRTNGVLFVIYGRHDFKPVVLLESLTNIDAKVFLPGDSSNRFADKSTGIGDVDADGFDDILFSDKDTGATYLVYGGTAVDDFYHRLNDPSVPNMTRLVNSASTLAYVYRGRAVSGGGDFNGDGFADFAVMEENTLERINIVFGRAERLPSTYDMNVENNSEGFTLGDVGDKVWTGALDLTADVNGDGLADLIVGSETTDTRRGAVYIVFGTMDNNNRQFGDTADTGTQLLSGVEENSRVGRFVHALGDINNDGIGDYSVGLENNYVSPPPALIFFGSVR